MLKTPESILKEIFGYKEFRGNQREIIDNALEGKNGFVLMPTGGGKSLCYQVPALLKEGMAVVISPLIALMQDQVAALKEVGVAVESVNSAMTRSHVYQVKQKIKNNELKLLYVSPERLLMPEFLELIESVKVSLFAIDEAHCVSQWGHDFRPVYTELAVLADKFKDVPRIALTATADAPTRRDIVEKLMLKDAQLFISGFDRPNINYTISHAENVKKKLIAFLKGKHNGDSGIIYCLSRKKTEETYEYLKNQGFSVYLYHAGMDVRDREDNQDKFIKAENVIMVATIEFGMGIDKPNVRFVVHMNLPKNIESYYQETGRAGRDGLPSNALMFYGISDIAIQKSFIEASESKQNQKRIEAQKLNYLLGLCEATSCRRQVILEYFGEC